MNNKFVFENLLKEARYAKRRLFYTRRVHRVVGKGNPDGSMALLEADVRPTNTKIKVENTTILSFVTYDCP